MRQCLHNFGRQTSLKTAILKTDNGTEG